MKDTKVAYKQIVDKSLKQQAEEISAVEKARAKNYSRQRDRRQTVQIRIDVKWHKKLKAERLLRKKPLSKIMDEILKSYF